VLDAGFLDVGFALRAGEIHARLHALIPTQKSLKKVLCSRSACPSELILQRMLGKQVLSVYGRNCLHSCPARFPIKIIIDFQRLLNEPLVQGGRLSSSVRE
jgi:hypothetical protein